MLFQFELFECVGNSDNCILSHNEILSRKFNKRHMAGRPRTKWNLS